MPTVRRARNLRWAAVAGGTALLIAIPAILGAVPARPAGAPSPGQLLDAVLGSSTVAHQGLAQVDGRVGLPELPFPTHALPLLDTSTRLRSWWVSPTSWRTDVLSAGGQQQEVTARGGTVTFDYENDVARVGAPLTGLRLPRPTDLLPGPLARYLLSWAGPEDAVVPLDAQRIAGVDAAGIAVVPADPGSSLARLAVWVDPATGLPVQVEVFATGSTEPALRSQLLDLSYDRPDAAVLSPELSTTVRWERRNRDVVSFLDLFQDERPPPMLGPMQRTDGGVSGIATYGEGYTRVALVVLPPQLVPRLLDSVAGVEDDGDPGRPRTTRVGSSQVAVLPSSLLPVALVVTPAGTGYLLAGTLTADAMTALLREAEPALVAAG
jgi:hypothetical protein